MCHRYLTRQHPVRCLCVAVGAFSQSACFENLSAKGLVQPVVYDLLHQCWVVDLAMRIGTFLNAEDVQLLRDLQSIIELARLCQERWGFTFAGEAQSRAVDFLGFDGLPAPQFNELGKAAYSKLRSNRRVWGINQAGQRRGRFVECADGQSEL